MQSTDQRSKYVIAAGAGLFFLGLITGFAVPAVTNPRMGLAGHLEGVMNGTFLIAVGAVWARLTLSSALQSLTFWLLMYGTYANWLFVCLAAIYGASEILPIAGAGYAALPWQETLVAIGLNLVGITMVVACAILVWGFIRKEEAHRSAA